MNILHVIGGVTVEGGGTTKYITELSKHQATHEEHRVSILTRYDRGDRSLVDDRVHFVFGNASFRRKQGFKSFGETLEDLHRDMPIEVVHVHGIWMPELSSAIRAAAGLKIPVLLSPHGMLEPGALEFSRWKKRAAMLFFQKSAFRKVDAFVATAQMEADNFAAYNLGKPVGISPPGVDLPEPVATRDWTHANAETIKTILFISRVHPKKNLVTLVEQFAAISAPGWQLKIVGPDEKGHTAEIIDLIERLGAQKHIQVCGPVFGADKEKLFQESSVFALPSLSENFGIVVPEALAYAVPVIASKVMPWEVLQNQNMGWWIDTDAKSVREALESAMNCKPEELAQMGRRGREYVVNTFQWQEIADALLDFYEEIVS